MERTATTPAPGHDHLYDVVRTSPFEFAQTAVGGYTVVRVGAVGVVGQPIVIDLTGTVRPEIDAQ